MTWIRPSYKMENPQPSGPTIVSFTDGTDEEIAAMLEAYYNDELTWEEMGWAVGDTRKIHLNSMTAPTPDSSQTWRAQDITVVIVAHNHTNLATAINGYTKACITVQTRETLSGTSAGKQGSIYINGSSDNDTKFKKWSNLYMRTYLNDKVWGAFPSGDFKSAIKPSKHYRHTTYNGTTSELVTDTLFLPSYPEIFGTDSYSYYKATSPVEGTQFDYYKTSSNRAKHPNNNGNADSSDAYWWQGSCSSYRYKRSSTGYYYYWCCVTPTYSSSYSGGSQSCGLAPAWAM